MDPEHYPSITIPSLDKDQQPDTYRIKFRMRDLDALASRDIDITVKRELQGFAALKNVVQVLAAGIIHQLLPARADDQSYASKIAELERDLMERIDMEMLPGVSRAIADSLSKAVAQAPATNALTA